MFVESQPAFHLNDTPCRFVGRAENLDSLVSGQVPTDTCLTLLDPKKGGVRDYLGSIQGYSLRSLLTALHNSSDVELLTPHVPSITPLVRCPGTTRHTPNSAPHKGLSQLIKVQHIRQCLVYAYKHTHTHARKAFLWLRSSNH